MQGRCTGDCMHACTWEGQVGVQPKKRSLPVLGMAEGSYSMWIDDFGSVRLRYVE